MINKKSILNLIQLLIGNALSGFSIACFAIPYDMMVSGVAGIGRVIYTYTGLSITMSVYIINISLFLLGLIFLGKKFAMAILVGSFTFPIFFQLFQNMESLQHLVEDPLLAAICAGILDGVGIGIILRIGGSTGGIDVPPIILNKKFGFKIAPLMYGMELAIFLLQLPVSTTNGVILGILYALIYVIIMNKIIVMDQGGLQLMIFSEHSDLINEKLLELGYGTSIIKGAGGYLREKRDIIYSIIGNRNLNRVKRAVLEIDKKAFITIANVSEVNGNGFTAWFGDEDYVPEVEKRRPGADF